MYNIGDKITFSLLGSDNLLHKNNDYLGKVLVLYTYPRDNTPGCTIEANNFKLLNKEFNDLNAIVLGLNHNSLKSHQNFIEKHCLPFNLLIDEDFTLLDKLNARKEENKVSRKTYIIDEENRLEKIYDKVTPTTHPNEVLEYLKSRKQ